MQKYSSTMADKISMAFNGRNPKVRAKIFVIELFTKQQNLSLAENESICRQQDTCNSKTEMFW